METLLRHREVLKMPDRTSGGGSSSGRGDVVFSCDGSPEARVALGVAIEQAASFGVRLLVVFGVRPPGRGGGEGFKEHRRVLELLGTKLGLRAVDEARAAGVEAEVLLVARRHVDAVCAVARERGARVVVVGTRGEGPIRGAVVGSVAHRLLGRCEAPVLCVQGPA